MALVVFYVIFSVLMAVLKFLEVRLDRSAERVRQHYSMPLAARQAPLIAARVLSSSEQQGAKQKVTE